jgi:hypothetical protein
MIFSAFAALLVTGVGTAPLRSTRLHAARQVAITLTSIAMGTDPENRERVSQLAELRDIGKPMLATWSDGPQSTSYFRLSTQRIPTQVVMLCDWNIARKSLELARNIYAQFNVARNFLLLRASGVILRDNTFAQLWEDHRCQECPKK